jgi:hypothetical protein
MELLDIKLKIQNILNSAHESPQKKKIIEHSDRFSFACPYCGDSSTDHNKKRGNYYFKNNYFVCYNEGCKGSIIKLCKDFNQHIDFEDKLSILALQDNHQIKSKVDLDILYDFMDKLIPVSEFLNWSQRPDSTFKVSKLKNSDPVVSYLKSRKIHDTSHIYQGWLYDIPIMVILNTVDDKLISLQYRSIGKKKIYKFYNFSQIYKVLMNLDLKEEELNVYDKISHYFKIFQVDFTQTVTIVESFLDSTFIKNSISLVGTHSDIGLFLNDTLDVRFIYDNDPVAEKSSTKDKLGHNKNLIKPLSLIKSENLIRQGHKVFLWKKVIRENNLKSNTKDINSIIEQKPEMEKYLYKYFSIDEFDIIDL